MPVLAAAGPRALSLAACIVVRGSAIAATSFDHEK
jgi:hypothetical protein